jgi:hypothetical protein
MRAAMQALAIGIALGGAAVLPQDGHAVTFKRPAQPTFTFTDTRTNIYPLAFGMSVDQASSALGAPLLHVRGKPGSETLLALRHHGGGGFFARSDRLYLQFRNGRLTALKGDWGDHWMWR